MDVERLRKRVAYIEALDRYQFASALAPLLTGVDMQTPAEHLAPLDYIRASPEMLAPLSAWAARVPEGDRFERLIDMADSYFLLKEDELEGGLPANAPVPEVDRRVLGVIAALQLSSFSRPNVGHLLKCR